MRSIVAMALVVMLAGCSGGGASFAPAAPAGTSPASITLSIVIPKASESTSSASRTPSYVSPATGSIVVQYATAPPASGTYTYGGTITVTPGGPSCVVGSGSQVCTTTFVPPATSYFDPFAHTGGGSIGFEATAYSGPGGTGAILATNQISGPGPSYSSGCTLQTASNNVCTVLMYGLPTSYVIAQASPFTDGTPGTSSLSITAHDAAGDPIVNSVLFAGTNGGLSDIRFFLPAHVSFASSGAGCSSSPNSPVGGANTIFGSPCVATISYDGAVGHASDAMQFSIETGFASATSSLSVYDYGVSSVKFYTTKLPAACSPAASLTIPVPTTQTNYAPPTLTNGAATC